jgi:hypothetical protein
LHLKESGKSTCRFDFDLLLSSKRKMIMAIYLKKQVHVSPKLTENMDCIRLTGCCFTLTTFKRTCGVLVWVLCMTERFRLRHVALTTNPTPALPWSSCTTSHPREERKRRNNDAASEISEMKRF